MLLYLFQLLISNHTSDLFPMFVCVCVCVCVCMWYVCIHSVCVCVCSRVCGYEKSTAQTEEVRMELLAAAGIIAIFTALWKRASCVLVCVLVYVCMCMCVCVLVYVC